MGGAILNPKSFELFNNSNLKLFFLDTLDADYFCYLMQQVDLASTLFLVISKSGETLETISLFATVLEVLKENEFITLKDHFLFITSSKPSTLRSLAEDLGSKIIIHEEIGGRFASFTNINLLPLMLIGADPLAFCLGGEEVLEDFYLQKENSLIAKSTAFILDKIERQYSIHVNMSYIRKLHQFLEWNNQIIAESLGKGGLGLTSISAHGPEDQHSQLQLYLDGPQDKFFTLFNTSNNEHLTLPKLNVLGIVKKDINDIIHAQHSTLYDVLLGHNIPVRKITIVDNSIKSLGALMMFSMLETIVLGLMQNINPFGQPAVEGMKELVYKVLR
jgi:glucose-6-phosphate isomerase